MKALLCLLLTVLFSIAPTGALASAPTFSTKNYQVKHATGLKLTQRNKDFLSAKIRTSFADQVVPAQGSLRGKVGPVEDQGQCGSCWDFSLTEVLRGTMIAAGKDPGRLSFNYLLNCATTMQGCNGGDFSAADFFINPKGAPKYGYDGDYTGVDGTCQAPEAKSVIAKAKAYHLLGSEAQGVVSFRDIAYVVGVLHLPVSVDLDASDGDFMNYSGGVYNQCAGNAQAIDHMVVVEGYDCEKSVDAAGNCAFDKDGNLPAGVGTWLIKNSWGDSWGDAGYITIKATDATGAKCQALATDALYFDL
jgi:C1A family cysteine protease